MRGDGNGWAAAGGGTAWGRFGAAGLLLVAPLTGQVLLQHRAEWTSQGGTWALPGGARDSHETPEDAALREAAEEAAVVPADIHIHTASVTAGPYPGDPARPELASGWTYTTVIATTVTGRPISTIANAESAELAWVGLDEVTERRLLPAFSDSWPALRVEVESIVARWEP